MEINLISIFPPNISKPVRLRLLAEIYLATLYNKELSKGIPVVDPPMERNNHSALDVKPVNAGGLNGLT